MFPCGLRRFIPGVQKVRLYFDVMFVSCRHLKTTDRLVDVALIRNNSFLFDIYIFLLIYSSECLIFVLGQNHLLRKSVGDSLSDFLLVVFLSASSDSEFHIFRPKFGDSGVSLTKVNSIYCPNKVSIKDSS